MDCKQPGKNKEQDNVLAKIKTAKMVCLVGVGIVVQNILKNRSYDAKYFDDVLMVPRWFHLCIHKQMNYNQARKCYETLTGILLDTKIKHMKHIQGIKAQLDLFN